MLKYKLVEETADRLSFRYFPEGKSDFGIVTVMKKTGEIIETILAKGDEFKWYLRHMIEEIEDSLENGEIRDEGMVAWY